MAQWARTKKSLEFWLLVIGTLAGVVGAAAAVGVFSFKTGDVGTPGATRTSSPTAAPPSAPTSAPGPSPTSAGPGEVTPGQLTRYLASLQPVAGPGFLQTKGNDLRMPCPTNQSDDRSHEVTYALPAPYDQLATGITVAGTADPDATAAIEVFIQHRQDRSDRQVRVGDPVALPQGGSTTFARALGDAVQLTLRITCQESTQVVVLTGPHITRKAGV